MKRACCAAIVSLTALAVSACTSTQDVLDPAAIALTNPVGTPMSEQVATAAPMDALASSSQASSGATGTTPTAALGETARVQLAPLIGTPAEVAAPLSERLAQQAGARGITIGQASDPAAALVLKGYFSALSENGTTTVIYVWDVYDRAGARLHRITGQQSGPSGKQEGWASVTASTMRAIADQTIDAFAAWAGGRSG